MARFVKGQSGNPNGRPKKRRPHVSAFDIVIDKTLTVTENGVERELTVDEALQLQAYQAAVGGSKPAVRAVLKMIEKREKALRASGPSEPVSMTKVSITHESNSADEAIALLDILGENPAFGGQRPRPHLVSHWAAQAALSRPGRRRPDRKEGDDLHLFVEDYGSLRRPRETRK